LSDPLEKLAMATRIQNALAGTVLMRLSDENLFHLWIAIQEESRFPDVLIKVQEEMLRRCNK
jgi:hypothetical protein